MIKKTDFGQEHIFKTPPPPFFNGIALRGLYSELQNLG